MLNARRTDQKYRGSYETAILKRFSQFAEPEHLHADLERLFSLIALNCAIRNGDAHLKNLGIRYDASSLRYLVRPLCFNLRAPWGRDLEVGE